MEKLLVCAVAVSVAAFTVVGRFTHAEPFQRAITRLDSATPEGKLA
jgi:hypothetical protein